MEIIRHAFGKITLGIEETHPDRQLVLIIEDRSKNPIYSAFWSRSIEWEEILPEEI